MKSWCVQVAGGFYDEFIASQKDLIKTETLGGDFFILTFVNNLPESYFKDSPLVRYAFPIEYRWPVSTASDEFIERASQGLLTKFSGREIWNVQTFSIEQGLKDRSKNLRGRLLQVFQKKLVLQTADSFKTWRQNPTEAPVDKMSLVVIVRAKEVFAGCISPQASGSHFAGGRRFVTQSVSRAGAKFVEALEYLKLKGHSVSEKARVLELGAAPGGMTSQIAKLGYEVIAVDRAALAPEVLKLKNVKYIRTDATTLELNFQVDLIVCDLNGSCDTAIEIVSHAARFLKKNGFVFFTLKLGDEKFALQSLSRATGYFAEHDLILLGAKHLFHNRNELTLMLTHVSHR